MKQPVLLVLEVPEDASKDKLREAVDFDLRAMGHKVVSVVPVSYTIDVPEGSITA